MLDFFSPSFSLAIDLSSICLKRDTVPATQSSAEHFQPVEPPSPAVRSDRDSARDAAESYLAEQFHTQVLQGDGAVHLFLLLQ